MGFRGRTRGAHVISLILDGRDPSNGVILHSCDNPKCVNPRHLSVGTHYENHMDSWRKGRACQGALSDDDVREIRELLMTDILQKEIAEAFGVSESTISLIKSGKRGSRIK